MKQAGEQSCVRLEGVPPDLFLESQNHQHDLIRELTLMDIGARTDATHLALPRRVTELIADILQHYGDVRSDTRDQALSALASGQETVTLLVPIRPQLAEALNRWLQLVEEADRFCSQGTLLTLAARPKVRALRRWYAETIAWCLDAPTGEIRVGHYPDFTGQDPRSSGTR